MQISCCYQLDVLSREAEQVAPPYALLLLYLPDFLLCVFYSKAGMHVKTLWSSSGQHDQQSNHYTLRCKQFAQLFPANSILLVYT